MEGGVEGAAAACVAAAWREERAYGTKTLGRASYRGVRVVVVMVVVEVQEVVVVVRRLLDGGPPAWIVQQSPVRTLTLTLGLVLSLAKRTMLLSIAADLGRPVQRERESERVRLQRSGSGNGRAHVREGRVAREERMVVVEEDGGWDVGGESRGWAGEGTQRRTRDLEVVVERVVEVERKG